VEEENMRIKTERLKGKEKVFFLSSSFLLHPSYFILHPLNNMFTQ
jgi:hypothetical protein